MEHEQRRDIQLLDSWSQKLRIPAKYVMAATPFSTDALGVDTWLCELSLVGAGTPTFSGKAGSKMNAKREAAAKAVIFWENREDWTNLHIYLRSAGGLSHQYETDLSRNRPQEFNYRSKTHNSVATGRVGVPEISVIPVDEEGKKSASSKELTQTSLSDRIQGKPRPLIKIFCILI